MTSINRIAKMTVFLGVAGCAVDPSSVPDDVDSQRSAAAFAKLSGEIEVGQVAGTRIVGLPFERLGGTPLMATDINGDHRDDLVTALPARIVGQTSKIRAYLAPFSEAGASATFTVPGFAAAVLDWNGDGAADLIVGDPLFYDGAGQVRVHLGPLDASKVAPDYTFNGTPSTHGPYKRRDELGFQVTSLGDVDGDGFGDFSATVVGENASYYDVRIAFGGASGAFSRWTTISTNGKVDSKTPIKWEIDGMPEVRGVGDVDHDGKADFVISAPRFKALQVNQTTRKGKIFLFKGSTVQAFVGKTLKLTDAAFTDERGSVLDPYVPAAANIQDYPFFGNDLAPMGDLNGDGHDDFIVSSGRLYEGLIYDGQHLNVASHWVPPGPKGPASIILSVAPAGDFNGDGFADALMSHQDGKVGLAYGPFGPWILTEATFVSTQAKTGVALGIGKHVVHGDFSGDGLTDLAFGAPHTGGDAPSSGDIFIVYGGGGLPAPTGVPDPEKSLPVGGVIITEFMANPAVCSDQSGEWIEIFNNTAAPVALNGLTVADQAGHSAKLASTSVLAPQSYATLGRGQKATFCGSFHPDAYYDSAVALPNGKGSISIAKDNVVIDTVTYGSAAAKNGKSSALMGAPSAIGNDTAANWAPSTTAMGAEKASPGAPNGP